MSSLHFMKRGGQTFLSRYHPSNLFSKFLSMSEQNARRFMYNNSLFMEQNTFMAIPQNNKQIVHSHQYNLSLQNINDMLVDLSILFIKRTFQPSIIRKRRKTGFLSRQKTVGGRRILERRRKKGRMRLGGC